MQNIVKLAGVLVVAMGMGAASTSAFAMGCLNSQNQMVTPSLSDDLASISGGTASALPTPYNVAQYNALVAAGNSCSTTEQSLPVQPTQQHTVLQSPQQQQ